MDISSQYGVNSVHWYFFNTLPTFFLGPLGLVPLLGGLVQSIRQVKNGPPKIFVFVLIWLLICYSALAHKEHRFILPLVPLCICYITYWIAGFSTKREKFEKIFIYFTLATHLPLTAYLSCVHQTGTTRVVEDLAEKFRPENFGNREDFERKSCSWCLVTQRPITAIFIWPMPISGSSNALPDWCQILKKILTKRQSFTEIQSHIWKKIMITFYQHTLSALIKWATLWNNFLRKNSLKNVRIFFIRIYLRVELEPTFLFIANPET